MLPKKFRLPIQKLPEKSSKNIRSPLVTIKVFSSDLGFPRFGVIISRKINKSAVKRNQLKRKFFLFAEEIFSKIKTADYLVIINKKEITAEELEKELNSAFKSLNV